MHISCHFQCSSSKNTCQLHLSCVFVYALVCVCVCAPMCGSHWKIPPCALCSLPAAIKGPQCTGVILNQFLLYTPWPANISSLLLDYCFSFRCSGLCLFQVRITRKCYMLLLILHNNSTHSRHWDQVSVQVIAEAWAFNYILSWKIKCSNVTEKLSCFIFYAMG